MSLPNDDPIPQSALLSDNGVEIGFIERRHILPIGTRVQTILVNAHSDARMAELVDELRSLLREIIDTYDVLEKNPPAQIRR